MYQIKEAHTKKYMNTNIPFSNEILPICLSGKMQSFIAKLQLPRILVSEQNLTWKKLTCFTTKLLGNQYSFLKNKKLQIVLISNCIVKTYAQNTARGLLT